jgi:hypothetical protein
VGDRTAALEVVQQAVGLCSDLNKANSSRLEADLALYLGNLSLCFADVGNSEAALTAIQRAVEIGIRLASADPARFNLDLANSLDKLFVGL